MPDINPSENLPSVIASSVAHEMPCIRARLATVAALASCTFSAGSTTPQGGELDTLTAASNGALTVDGVAVNANDVLLVNNQATASNNGVYVVVQPGTSGTPFILRRAARLDSTLDINGPVLVLTGNEGTQNGNTLFQLNISLASAPALNTSALAFSAIASQGAMSGVTGGFSAYMARAVFTSTTVASYTGTGTSTLTAGTNGPLASQDGVSLAVGDTVLLQGGTLGSLAITAADTGPWVVSSLGASGAKWVLVRPSWWVTGAVMPAAAQIQLGPEGTLFAGTTWTSWATPGSAVIGTNDPAFYPDRVIQSVALAASTTTVTNVPIRSATKSAVQVSFVAAGGSTTSTVGYGVIAAPTPGYIGSASTVIDALASGMGKNGSSDTSTVAIVIVNR